MHTYYAENKDKLKKETNKMLSLIRSELEEASGKKYDINKLPWQHPYKK